jgi:hypothetical protein
MDEIQRAVKSLKARKAAGEDGIPPELYKYGGETVISVLKDILDLIWTKESLPQAWYKAVIIPIFKKGDQTDCSNYRGISLLDIALKILEAVILDRMRGAYTPRENQAGFRSGRGCRDQIFALRQLLETRYEYRRPTALVFIDFKAAFDSVARESIYTIAVQLGFPSKIVSMIQCLYRSTQSVVRAYGKASEPFDVVTGVRQGSILSPFLFNMVVDEVLRKALDEPHAGGVQISTRSEPLFDLAYADDIVVLAESSEYAQLMLDRVSLEASKVGLRINVGKTKVMYSCCEPAAVALNGQALEIVNSFTYLGSEITPTGDVTNETRKRIAKASGAFRSLERCLWSRNDISAKTKARVYDAAIRSILLYGCETWPMKVSDEETMASFERRCWRKAIKSRPGVTLSNREVERRFLHECPLSAVIQDRRLRWAGHVLRMEDSRLPLQLLRAGPIRGWRRPVGGVRTTWRRRVAGELECFAKPYNWTSAKWLRDWVPECVNIAQNRSMWRGTVRDAVEATIGRQRP